MVGILDLRIGNLRSVANAVEENGFEAILIEEEKGFQGVTHLILPGVGHFGAAMEEITRRKWKPLLLEYVSTGRPLLGTCLGMQLLMETSEEGGQHQGLGLIPGGVRRLVPSGGLRIPHIGWNSVHFQQAHPVLEGIPNDRDFYFAHSFGVEMENKSMVIGTTEYGGAIAAVIGKKNIIGCQFHPEKSQVHGLRVMENFCRWNGRC